MQEVHCGSLWYIHLPASVRYCVLDCNQNHAKQGHSIFFSNNWSARLQYMWLWLLVFFGLKTSNLAAAHLFSAQSWVTWNILEHLGTCKSKGPTACPSCSLSKGQCSLKWSVSSVICVQVLAASDKDRPGVWHRRAPATHSGRGAAAHHRLPRTPQNNENRTGKEKDLEIIGDLVPWQKVCLSLSWHSWHSWHSCAPDMIHIFVIWFCRLKHCNAKAQPGIRLEREKLQAEGVLSHKHFGNAPPELAHYPM